MRRDKNNHKISGKYRFDKKRKKNRSEKGEGKGGAPPVSVFWGYNEDTVKSKLARKTGKYRREGTAKQLRGRGRLPQITTRQSFLVKTRYWDTAMKWVVRTRKGEGGHNLLATKNPSPTGGNLQVQAQEGGPK